MDGILPECQTETDCPIPRLTAEARRVMKLRSMLVRLHEIIDPGTICKMFNATLDDLELLALVEDELKPDTATDHPGDT